MKISIIIPVLNESQTVNALLGGLQAIRARGHEIIVVDGGSTDDTVPCLNDTLYDRLLITTAGRACQMNLGAEYATGDLFWFLHVDSRVSKDLLDEFELSISKSNEFENRGVVNSNKGLWGWCKVSLDGQNLMFRIIETLINWRASLTSVATGDQGMFMSKAMFEQVGGYPPIELMEDVAICKMLRKRCKPLVINNRLQTSVRRWRQNGIWRTIFLMWRLRLGYFLGVKPSRLARYYRDCR